MQSLDKRAAPYTLRSCLGKEPLAVVKGIEDNLEEMWKRLDDTYGDPAKVADAVINSVRRFKTIKEGDNRRFVEFVDVVDSGFRDLQRLGLENEITTTSSVSIVEKKLPPDIRREWAKLVTCDSGSVDKTDKFPSLLQFLLNYKRAIEYESAELRTPGYFPANVKVNHVNASEDNSNHREKQEKSKTSSNCLLHEKAAHTTSDCTLYLSKSQEERMNFLKEKGACWSCLKLGHRSRYCRRRRTCGIDNCIKTHHRTLHTENQQGSTPAIASVYTTPQIPNRTGHCKDQRDNVSATASVCNSGTNETCLLQLQEIRTR